MWARKKAATRPKLHNFPLNLIKFININIYFRLVIYTDRLNCIIMKRATSACEEFLESFSFTENFLSPPMGYIEVEADWGWEEDERKAKSLGDKTFQEDFHNIIDERSPRLLPCCSFKRDLNISDERFTPSS